MNCHPDAYPVLFGETSRRLEKPAKTYLIKETSCQILKIGDYNQNYKIFVINLLIIFT